jgi:hypothetical protein
MHRYRPAMDACVPLLRNATGTSTGILIDRKRLTLLNHSSSRK